MRAAELWRLGGTAKIGVPGSEAKAGFGGQDEWVDVLVNHLGVGRDDVVVVEMLDPDVAAKWD